MARSSTRYRQGQPRAVPLTSKLDPHLSDHRARRLAAVADPLPRRQCAVVGRPSCNDSTPAKPAAPSADAGHLGRRHRAVDRSFGRWRPAGRLSRQAPHRAGRCRQARRARRARFRGAAVQLRRRRTGPRSGRILHPGVARSRACAACLCRGDDAVRPVGRRVPRALCRLLRPGLRPFIGRWHRLRAVLEVRSHEVPFILEHGQVVGRLVYERMRSRPQATSWHRTPVSTTRRRA